MNLRNASKLVAGLAAIGVPQGSSSSVKSDYGSYEGQVMDEERRKRLEKAKKLLELLANPVRCAFFIFFHSFNGI